MSKCLKSLEEMGHYSQQEGKVDYQSGFRIFPLLQFIMNKKSIPANDPQQSVFMQDNPIFVTTNQKFANTLVFATIHSKRSAVLNGIAGFPDNDVTSYYEPMVIGSKEGYKPVVPSTDKGTSDKLVEVNRETWANELSKYTTNCKNALLLPPTNTKRPFFEYNGAIFPFTKEIDFVAGADGVGFGMLEIGRSYYLDEKKMEIPILIYSPKNKVENVVMLQDGLKLKFHEDEYNRQWQKWLGKDWHAFASEKIDYDEKALVKADNEKIHSSLPPLISDSPVTIQATINGEKVTFVNQ